MTASKNKNTPETHFIEDSECFYATAKGTGGQKMKEFSSDC